MVRLDNKGVEPLRVLYVDDNDDEAMLFKLAVARVPVKCSVHIEPGADAAMQYLQKTPMHRLPELIFCDYKMPRMNGVDFVSWLRASRFDWIPAVILSCSTFGEDIQGSYEAGANAFLIKPSSADQLFSMLSRAIGYWSQCRPM